MASSIATPRGENYVGEGPQLNDFFDDFLGSELMDDHGFMSFEEEPTSISLASGNGDDTNWLSISPKDSPCFKGLHGSAHDLLLETSIGAEILSSHDFMEVITFDYSID